MQNTGTARAGKGIRSVLATKTIYLKRLLFTEMGSFFKVLGYFCSKISLPLVEVGSSCLEDVQNILPLRKTISVPEKCGRKIEVDVSADFTIFQLIAQLNENLDAICK